MWRGIARRSETVGSESDRESGDGRVRAASEARGQGRSRRMIVRDGATTTERDHARRRWDGTHILDVSRVCFFHGGYGSPRVSARESTPPGVAWVSRGSLWGNRWASSTSNLLSLQVDLITFRTSSSVFYRTTTKRKVEEPRKFGLGTRSSIHLRSRYCTAVAAHLSESLGRGRVATLCIRVEPWRTLQTRTGERARPPVAGSPPARSSSRSSSPSPVRIPPSSSTARRAFSPAGRLPSRIPDLSTPRSLPGADVFSTFKDATQDAQFIAPTADQRSLGGKVHISFCQS